MKILEPKISATTPCNLLDSYEKGEFNNQMYSENIDRCIFISNVTFDSCIFNGIDFTNISLDNVDLVGVIFEDCDLSNKVLIIDLYRG